MRYIVEHKPTLRVVKVIETVSSNNGEMTMSEIARLTDIPRGTILPILQTLCENHFLHLDAKTMCYSIDLRLFLAGSPFAKSSESFAGLQLAIKELTRKSGETAHFGILDNGNVLYVLKSESPKPVHMYSDIGKILPAYGTAIGKALISDYSKQEIIDLYGTNLKKLTEKTITDIDTLYEQIEEIRRTGFATECEESNIGIRCIATPIKMDNRVVAAISIVIPLFRYSEEKQTQIENILKEGRLLFEELLPHSNIIT